MLESNQTNEAFNTLREKLREMFHFAHNDLDFGIFRILKIKRDEVNQFINEKLPSIVDKAIEKVTNTLYDRANSPRLRNSSLKKARSKNSAKQTRVAWEKLPSIVDKAIERTLNNS